MWNWVTWYKISWFLDVRPLELQNNQIQYFPYLVEFRCQKSTLQFFLLKVMEFLNILQWKSSQVIIHTTLGQFCEQKNSRL